MDAATLILACGNPFKNVGPFGWFVIYAFLAAFVISCILAIVNPILAATMKTPPARKRLHLGLAAAYVVPGLAFVLMAMSGVGMDVGFVIWLWVIYVFVLPVWTGIHFLVLLAVRRELRQVAQNPPPPTD